MGEPQVPTTLEWSAKRNGNPAAAGGIWPCQMPWHQKKKAPFGALFLLVPVVGVEPTRYCYHRILSYSSHSEPNGLNRNKTVFSVTFQNIKNPKKPYKISIFDAKHQKYKQFVPSSIIGSQIPNLRRWRDVGGM